jgi:D-glycero-alpha-D-manno-heptose-7-phosphate kinase
VIDKEFPLTLFFINNQKMKIIVTTPTRCGLIGGGTDVDPFASEHGGKILSIALNLSMKAELIPHSSPIVHLESLGEKRTLINLKKRLNYGKDAKFDLIRAIINFFYKSIPSGFYLRTSAVTDADKIMGLGGSGAVAVAVINAFNCWLQRDMSKMEIALLASKLETEELGWPGGKQDQLAASFGDINLLTFGPGTNVQEKIKKLRDWSMMFFIGGYRHSKEQQTILMNGMVTEEKMRALMNLRDAVDQAINFINNGDLANLGKILHLAWQDKKRSNPIVSNDVIDNFYETALQFGALGGKIMGAGGAGNMFFIVPPSKQNALKKALVKKGAQLINFNFDFEGTKIKISHSKNKK